MDKTRRMKADPLDWLGETAPESKPEPKVKPIKPVKPSKRSKPVNTQTRQTPAQPERERKSTEAGLKEGWVRAAFVVRKDQVEKVKALAWWERKEIKAIMSEALHSYLERKGVKATLAEALDRYRERD